MSCDLGTSWSNWRAHRWDDVIGNYRMKRFVRALATKIRTAYETTGKVPLAYLCPLLLVGGSRTGKTEMFRMLTRYLMCNALDADGNPCPDTCPACRERPDVEGRAGLFAEVVNLRAGVPIDIRVLDGGRINTPAAINQFLANVTEYHDRLTLVFVDEAHRLAPNHGDEMLLKFVEDFRGLVILATANPEPLDAMLCKRLIVQKTEPPTDSEFAGWIANRCLDFNVPFEDEAIIELVHESNRVPGLALKKIAEAGFEPAGLTLEFLRRTRAS